MRDRPRIVILAGPNGAGKTTSATAALGRSILVDEYVNADVIAQELAPGEPERAAFEAGRRALEHIDDLVTRRTSFAFETTLAGRSYVRWLQRAAEAGYLVQLMYFWLPSPDQAVRRVARRVTLGGHGIPEDVIRRRYAAGLRKLLPALSRAGRRMEVVRWL